MDENTEQRKKIPTLYNVKQVARMIQVTPTTVRRMIAAGRIMPVAGFSSGGNGRRYLFTEDEVMALINGPEPI